MWRSFIRLPHFTSRQKRVLLSLWLINFCFFVFLGGTLNPLKAGEQFKRRIQPTSLLDENNPDLIMLNASFAQFLIESEQYVNIRDQFNTIGEYDAHMVEIFTYLQVKHKYDLMQHLSIDHFPSISDIIQSGVDDGDGRTIFAASILIYRGHDAWALFGPWHSWVELILENGTVLQILTKNGLGMDLWYLRFNAHETQFQSLQTVIYVVNELVLAAITLLVLFGVYQVTQSDFMRHVIKSLSIFAIVTGILLIVALVIVLLFYRVLWGG